MHFVVFVIVRVKLTSISYASVLLLTTNCVIRLWVHSSIASWINSYFDHGMTKFMIMNRTDA